EGVNCLPGNVRGWRHPRGSGPGWIRFTVGVRGVRVTYPVPAEAKPKTPIGRRGASLIHIADYPREEHASPAPLHCPQGAGLFAQPEAEWPAGGVGAPGGWELSMEAASCPGTALSTSFAGPPSPTEDPSVHVRDAIGEAGDAGGEGGFHE